MDTPVTTPVVKGLIISLILIVISIALYFAGLSQNQALNSIQYAIIVGAIIWGCINYSNQSNHNVTFGNVFAHGFKITAVVTVIMVVYTVIAIKFLFPEMVDLSLEKAREGMVEKNLTDDQIDQAMGLTQKFFVPFAIAGIMLVFMVIGLISSLVGAAVAKKNPENPFQQG